MAGTSATLLARRWESALLVNVDNDTLKRLIDNREAMDALMHIEGFRSLNSNTIETIINRSEKVKKGKAESEKLTSKEKKEVSEEEKEVKSLRKQVQEKLIKFATRIPVFMYLTDYRERSLQDVITQLEPELFKKVTGLDTKDFEILCSIGVFNSSLMNEAIFKFKRYEDSSLSYTGIDKHKNDETIGGWDTVIKKKEYELLFYNQQESMKEVDNPFNKVIEQAQDDTYPVNDDEETFNEIDVPKVADNNEIYDNTIEEQMEKFNSLKEGNMVYHKKFGEGKVTWIDKKRSRIKINFQAGEKQFLFPDAFLQGHLKFI